MPAQTARGHHGCMTQQSYDAGRSGSATDQQTDPRQDLRFLRRSSDDRMIAGVCGGLGRYTSVDPVVFRISFAVLAVFGGAGLVLYALGWLLVPDEQSSRSTAQQWLNGRSSAVAAAALGAAVCLVAIGFLAGHGWPGPLLTVLLVVALVALVVHRRGWGGMFPAGAAQVSGRTPPGEPAAAEMPEAPESSGEPPPWEYAEPAPQPARSPARQDHSTLAPAALSLAFVVVGVLVALDLAGALNVTPAVVFAAALLTVGVTLVAGAWLGRSRGLIAVGAVLTVGLMAASLVDVPLRGGIGARDVTPSSLAEVQSTYHLGIGRETLDLSGIRLNGAARHISATVGIGQLHIVVPSTATVVVQASASAGSVEIDGIENNGRKVSRSVTLPATSTPADGTLKLDMHAGVGQVVVDRVVVPHTVGPEGIPG